MLKQMLFFALLLSFCSCISNQRATGSHLVNDAKTNAISSEDLDNPIDLTAYLYRISGVAIRGNGSSAVVRVRGPVSFVSEQGPLFVLNGTKLGFDYSTIYNAINPRDISRVKVLKNASEAAFYGSQAAGGVVEIFLK
jgi:TonB-dependent SusC/RagA subfamily outer membrane receptor